MNFLKYVFGNIINKFNISTLILVCAFTVFTGVKVYAQQAIINVPSSDVIPKGQTILKDSNRFSPFPHNGYVSISPTVTLGVGHNIEIAGGASVSMAKDTRVRGEFSAKKVYFIKNNSRFTIGTKINPYLMESKPPYNFSYAHFSTRIKKTQTSLTSGVFVASSDNILPDQPGAILGLEQVLIPNKLRFAADWISRNEAYGLFSTGLKYRPTPTTTITSAVLVPNGNKGDVGFLISISKLLDANDD